ncbi:aminoacyl-tRNA hydrolase [Cupriavidus sp. USMAA2-4]|uniref:Peptidyl-tRNA hydrolase n=1 Tax=Cupriavidus malaysiensis TaxID=367825 RepID=A0ABN4TT66_9BURK|nr:MULTISPECIES: aminoacyl-tRNA hydrolase [Cupriavidus]AOY94074.1 aminoacyl-tRNA hydrolase [Cupriavidus sp. USMAA2-4]AOZ01108.1 aminoacyl-tRNA hydrolase [Cupriavidus sp. USMAHM13]AOZ07936.1 aminoacyl-tRNA hydrolase [Cupriavidus malaysiensis]
MIKLIVGLGNPGAEYEATRHNAGFWLVDQLARQAGTTLRVESRFHGLAARARLWDQEIWLLKPSTFMNRSGLSVVSLARFYKILPDEILVAHDEMDLPPGTVKLKRGGGSGGHNGLKDISAHLTTPEYWRLRIGVGHPRNQNAASGREEVVNFVLKPPRREEQQAIDESIERCLDPLALLARGESERAMMALHSGR